MSFRRHKHKGARCLTPTPRLEADTTLNGGNTEFERKLWRRVGRQRARKLRQRGTPVFRGFPVEAGVYYWAQTPGDWWRRALQRDIAKSLRKAAQQPLYWNDVNLSGLTRSVEQAIIDRLRLYPGESLFDIQTGTGYQLDVLGRVPGESDAELRRRYLRESPEVMLTIPMSAVLNPPTEPIDFTQRQRIADAHASDEFYDVTLNIPGRPPQVLKGFDTSEPFETRPVGMVPELAAPFGPNKVMSPEELERRYGKPLE